MMHVPTEPQESGSTSPNLGHRRFAKFVLRRGILVCAIVFFILAVRRAVHELQRTEIPIHWESIHWTYIILSVLAGMLALIPPWIAWHAILRDFGQNVLWSDSLVAYLMGHLGKYVPGKAMAVLLRVGELHRHKVPWAGGVECLYRDADRLRHRWHHGGIAFAVDRCTWLVETLSISLYPRCDRDSFAASFPLDLASVSPNPCWQKCRDGGSYHRCSNDVTHGCLGRCRMDVTRFCALVRAAIPDGSATRVSIWVLRSLRPGRVHRKHGAWGTCRLPVDAPGRSFSQRTGIDRYLDIDPVATDSSDCDGRGPTHIDHRRVDDDRFK